MRCKISIFLLSVMLAGAELKTAAPLAAPMPPQPLLQNLHWAVGQGAFYVVKISGLTKGDQFRTVRLALTGRDPDAGRYWLEQNNAPTQGLLAGPLHSMAYRYIELNDLGLMAFWFRMPEFSGSNFLFEQHGSWGPTVRSYVIEDPLPQRLISNVVARGNWSRSAIATRAGYFKTRKFSAKISAEDPGYPKRLRQMIEESVGGRDNIELNSTEVTLWLSDDVPVFQVVMAEIIDNFQTKKNTHKYHRWERFKKNPPRDKSFKVKTIWTLEKVSSDEQPLMAGRPKLLRPIFAGRTAQ